MKKMAISIFIFLLLTCVTFAGASSIPDAFVTLSNDAQIAYSDEVVLYVDSCLMIEELQLQETLTTEDSSLLEELLFDFAIAHDSGCFGWNVVDLDENGIPELIIATDTDEPYFSKLILEICTLTEDENCEPILISEENDRIYWLSGNKFAEISTNSADDSMITTLEFADGCLTDLKTQPNEADIQQFPVIDVYPVQE